VTVTDLFVGNSITVYNRLITIKKYANVGTSNYMKSRETHILLNIRASATSIIGEILKASEKNKLVIGKVRTTEKERRDINALAGDVLIQLIGYEGDKEASKFIDFCAQQYNNKISATLKKPSEMLDLMNDKFPFIVNDELPATLCLIKPHTIRENKVADLISDIVNENNGMYKIAALTSVHLTTVMAEEIFNVYRDIFPKYSETIGSLISAPCFAIYLTASDPQDFHLVEKFREFTGPMNPELAQTLRPETLRAKYGTDAIENAVHITDLAEDGHMECKYFFETIAGL
jgi:nucleoside-diphosphate kinase